MMCMHVTLVADLVREGEGEMRRISGRCVRGRRRVINGEGGRLGRGI